MDITLRLAGRIDANNAQEWEGKLLPEAGQGNNLILDAEGLEYISSAGLRVLLKLHKIAENIRVINASQDVFNILEVTGFTELLDVRKKLREVSVEGCEFIGSGGYGRVYRLDSETIVKLYNPGLSLELVEQERNNSQKAFLMGVPTAISYDVVRCGNCFGVVYEMLNAKTVAQIIDAQPDNLHEVCSKCAILLKSLHEIVPGPEAGLPDRKQELLMNIDALAGLITDDEIRIMKDFINSIPDRNTFLHGDFNSKTIMLRDGEFQLIDIGDAAVGHPVFDVAGLMLAYIILPQSRGGRLSDQQRRGLLGFDFELAPKVWNVLCSTYFGLKNIAEVQNMTDKLMPYCLLLMGLHSFRLFRNVPDVLPMILNSLRERVLPALENTHSLDFWL